MLEPREADLPALFLVLVVLPVVAYFLLGKWSEASTKWEKINLLAQLAAEEALKAEAMAAASVIPIAPSPPVKNVIHVCARCLGPATTRCSGCKTVRYCSGRCQIIHWRKIHKLECLQVGISGSSPSPNFALFEDSLLNESIHDQFLGYNNKQAVTDEESSEHKLIHSSQSSFQVKRTSDKKISGKINRERLRREDGAGFHSREDALWSRRLSESVSSNNISSRETLIGKKLSSNDVAVPVDTLNQNNDDRTDVYVNGQNGRSIVNEIHNHQDQHQKVQESRYNSECSSSLCFEKTVAVGHETDENFVFDEKNKAHGKNDFDDEIINQNCSEVMRLKEVANKSKLRITSISPNSLVEIYKEQPSPDVGGGKHIGDELNVTRIQDGISVQGSNAVGKTGLMKMMGFRKSTKLARHDVPEFVNDKPKILKTLFPYEEYMKLFQYEVFDLSPRGLLNCGNSCYANAVLQCLTGTRPLIIYLLRRSHSKACYGKDWCLLCELEQHVMMLRESGGPLSLSRILSHMRSINFQIGDGSQEDAHEFLRLLVASMQSICLEGMGGEQKVDSRLKDTTFVQHTFGGRLRSKVKCLKCYHESERYEDIMDLTLEIYGRVESLEDALTQFTKPEDLDGENMYRCGRCATYVRARKQLSIHEAPNILTIVLKRFQEGKYGKINKYITFPEMLDMVPFMTGTVDIPPLYLLYAVVVHLDTLNASFSGHYVSYVKDLQENWYRIDDTEVHSVSLSQVMSEGAYILFYMRSSPRPQRTLTEKASRKQAPVHSRNFISKSEKSSHSRQTKSGGHLPGVTGFSNRTSNGNLRRSANKNILHMMETYREPAGVEFSDATSSDWSLFTSSDEASFTTESTRDSFSTVDHADMSNADPFQIFNNTVSCRLFSNSKPRTRFVREAEKGHVVSYSSSYPVNGVSTEKNSKQVVSRSSQSDSNHAMFVNCGSNSRYHVNQPEVNGSRD